MPPSAHEAHSDPCNEQGQRPISLIARHERAVAPATFQANAVIDGTCRLVRCRCTGLGNALMRLGVAGLIRGAICIRLAPQRYTTDAVRRAFPSPTNRTSGIRIAGSSTVAQSALIVGFVANPTAAYDGCNGGATGPQDNRIVTGYRRNARSIGEFGCTSRGGGRAELAGAAVSIDSTSATDVADTRRRTHRSATDEARIFAAAWPAAVGIAALPVDITDAARACR